MASPGYDARMFRLVGAFLSLFVFWLLLSGMFTPFLVASGAGCAITIALLAQRMNRADHAGRSMHLVWPAALSYIPWLLVEIIKSGWDVSKRILNPALPISPALVEFKPSQTSDVGLVIHANSITLTPGTIAVEVEPHRFLVHALTQSNANGLAGSDMDHRCLALEGR